MGTISFQSNEDIGGYGIAAAVPRLDLDSLRIETTDEQTSVTISGMCLPTARQAEQMRQQVAAQLERIARTSPQAFQEVSDRLDRVIADAYVELGNCRFGCFSQTFRMPMDVDAERIHAFFDEGVLRVSMPRKVRRHGFPMSTRSHPRVQSRRGLWGHPAFGW